jgi:hypothetical protein
MSRLFTVLFLLVLPSTCYALEMSVKLVSREKLAYVNLWGSIDQDDSQKFQDTILPVIASGYLVYKINIFSSGGNVNAAMGIGNQIRELQTRTVAPFKEAVIINNKRVQTDTTICSFEDGNGYQVYPRFVHGEPWCTCASACFLIWASGVVREGSVVGVHRPYRMGPDFGNLPVATARADYESIKQNYTAYLQKLDVPVSITEKLFANDSHEMQFLDPSELRLMESTPYLEEMTYSRCGPDRTEHMSAKNNWTATQDIQHVNCYRGILKEVMTEGAAKYLAAYGSDRVANPAGAPAVPRTGSPSGQAEPAIPLPRR